MSSIALRMYFFVPYNISAIQQGIQAGHAALEYAKMYGHEDQYKEFIDNHKTWIILNGGSTNNDIDSPGSMQKMLNMIIDFNEKNETDKINYSTFYEPDLNNALTSICFIADERCWEYIDNPDWDDCHCNNFFEVLCDKDEDSCCNYTEEKNYKSWLELIGGKKNLFIRDLIRDKKLA